MRVFLSILVLIIELYAADTKRPTSAEIQSWIIDNYPKDDGYSDFISKETKINNLTFKTLFTNWNMIKGSSDCEIIYTDTYIYSNQTNGIVSQVENGNNKYILNFKNITKTGSVELDGKKYFYFDGLITHFSLDKRLSNDYKKEEDKNQLAILISETILKNNNLTIDRFKLAFEAYTNVCNKKVDKNLF